MSTPIAIQADQIFRLDIAPVEAAIGQWQQSPNSTPPIQLAIDFPREEGDPRELSEIAEVRLWFVRLDATYPWLLALLDWEAGELARYTAMLVPHQFSSKEGIQFNPEALELFVMQKVFVLGNWLRQQGTPSRSKLKFMTQMLGYELDDGFFQLIGF